MSNLVQAFGKAATTVMTQLPRGDSGIEAAQRGGTCGLYSLWYATILLKVINPQDSRPVVIPRGQVHGGMSLRKFSKTLGSGQGEVLNWQEMFSVINHSRYECDIADSDDAEDRKRFIHFSLEKNRPILMAYMEGGTPGQDCHPSPIYDGSNPDNYGPHWCLLIAETATDYGIVDPHWPNTIRYYPKDQVLKSNALTDTGASFPNVYSSTHLNKQGQQVTKNYDLHNPQKRQTLKNLLISVY